jgi:hypothetical protein
MPYGGNVQYGERNVLESDGRRRDRVHGHQQVHRDLRVCGGHVHGVESRHLCRERHVSPRGHLRSRDRMFESRGAERNVMQRRECVYTERRLHGWGVRWSGGWLRQSAAVAGRSDPLCRIDGADIGAPLLAGGD